MIRFIWQNWWRRKERFILLLVGALIVSAGLTYLVGLSDTNKGTVVDTLRESWSASYDIVVRPDGSRSVTEDKKLLEPNYLSGLDGGISVDQYETIKDIANVDVAAPIAMIGYALYTVNFGDVELDEEGIYRKKTTTVIDNGLEESKEENNYYFPAKNVWDEANKGYEYGAGGPSLDMSVTMHPLLAGIDPEQEAKLVGLDDAIMDLGDSRYFIDTDTSSSYEDDPSTFYQFPVIVNTRSLVDKTTTFTFERVDLPIDKDSADEVMENVKEKGADDYLDTLDGLDTQSFSFTEEEAFKALISGMTGADWETGEEAEASDDTIEIDGSGIVFRPSPLAYNPASSPFSERWPFAYQVVPHQNGDETVGNFANIETYRDPNLIADEFVDYPLIEPNWVGFYDPATLDISKDPKNELPVETYRPATAELVMDTEGNPINPPTQLKPSDDPYDFLTNPPGMLTTIETAEQILGEEPISAIRIKVAGVSELNEDSQAILEQVANDIESQTGLITDITLGSSPQLTLTQVPGINDDDAIGWLQQPWVNIGSSISIFKETKIGFFGVIASVIVVAIIYVWASGMVSLLARRKEFAVLLSVGWRPRQLSKLLLLESTILGVFVAMIAWMMLGFVYMSGDATISLSRFIWTGLFGFVIYLLGAVIPSLLVRRISPYEAMRTGEISKTSKRLFRTRGLTSMAFNHFIGKWRRSLLSILSISLPTALLALFIYVTFRLQGIMFTTWLGQYVALEVGPVHYIAIIVALIIAILTTAEIMWQNVSERREEFSLLRAIGWKNTRVRRLILAEGVFSGIFAAIIGLVLAFMIIWGLYQAFPTEGIGYILATGLVPIIIGTIGAAIPAERAVRMTPSQGISGSYSIRRAVERRMKWAVISIAVLLVGGFIYTMVQVAPNVTTDQGTEDIEAVSPTTDSGGTESVSATVDKEKDTEDQSDKSVGSDYWNEDRIENLSKSGVVEGDNGLDSYVMQIVMLEGEDIQEISTGESISFTAERTESTLPPPEDGMRNIAIEINIKTLSNGDHIAQLRQSFSIKLTDGDFFYPVGAKVLDSKGWEDKSILKGDEDGMLKAVLEFTIPGKEEKAFMFEYKDQTIIVLFE